MSRFKQPAQLHNHSKYSLLDAVPSPEEWVTWCLENDTSGFAVTDHGTSISMYDALNFPKFIEKYNKKNGTDHALDSVTGIPAVELYVKLTQEDADRWGVRAKEKGHFHITVWATSIIGYHNLMKLSSIAYEDVVTYFGSPKARVTYTQIEQYKEGLKFGTGCIIGPIGAAILHDDDYEEAEKRFVMYRKMFGDDLYVEFHPTDITHDFNWKTGGFDPIAPTECACDGNQQLAYNKFLMDMVDKYPDSKPIPVTDAHFVMPEDKVLQDCLLKNGNDNGWYFYESYHQKQSEDIYTKLRSQLGEWLTEEKFAQWVENTYEVRDAAKSLFEWTDDGDYCTKITFDFHLPKIPIPDYIKEKTDDYDKQTFFLLMEKCQQHGRWKTDPVYIERFKTEIDVIMKNKELNFIPYFLLYEDICTYARSVGTLQGIGRGSAGGSIISYYLKIIHIDPIINDLPFERFLSHARINAMSFPDIDCDFGDRTPIINYLQEKYGLGFAQISTFQKMKTKNAIKDSMWAIYARNREDPEVKAVCNTVPDSPQGIDEYDFLYGYTDKEDNYHMGLVETNQTLANFFDQYPDIEHMVKRLIGVIRGWGRHASAYVISTVDLATERVPTMQMFDKHTGKNITVTQFDASMCEDRGLVKADILGVTTINALEEAVQLIKDRTGRDLLLEDSDGISELYRLPEDEGVYADFYNKKTDSSFQFNTGTVKGHLKQFMPQTREHLSDLTALLRPGAMDAPMANEDISLDDNVSAAQYYMDVRSGDRRLSFLHPDLKDYTSNGVFVYQEQIMKFLVDFAGYTGEESDRIRGAIAKKKMAIMMEAFDRIRKECDKRGWEPEAADIVCDQVLAFSRYSFNRSHSRCYSELGYITMYLKHYYPLEWWSAVLNTSNEIKMRFFMTLLGDIIKPPSIASPSSKFTVLGEHIIAPISALKRVGPAAVGELITKGPFADLDDYLEKVDHRKANAGAFAALVRGRALDCFIDTSISYADGRASMLTEYVKKRKCKPFQESMYELDPMAVFLMERDTNKCFNKSLLSDPALRKMIMAADPDLTLTGRSGVPMMHNSTPVIANLKIAAGIVERKKDDEVGMILLYEGSKYKKITSKKTGKSYDLLEVTLSDGFASVQCSLWGFKKALGWNKNQLVWVTGTLSEGFKMPVSIKAKDINKLGE